MRKFAPVITNAQIKLIRSLREKKFRDREGLFVVEGDKMVKEALASGFDVVEVFRADEIGTEAMSRISSQSTPAPSLAVVRIPAPSPLPEPSGLCLALDTVRDPGNLGTIVRLADWFGIEQIYASEHTVELYNPKTVQATMGSVFRKRVHYCNLPDVCRRFTAAGLEVYGTYMEGESLYTAGLKSDGLIIMGNEANGISAEVSSCITRRITVPSFAEGATSESLNVAIATAITVSEFRRRQSFLE